MSSIENKPKKRILCTFFVTLAVVALSAGFGLYINSILKKIPENIYVLVNDEAVVEWNVPVTGNTGNISASKVDFSRPVTFKGTDVGTYDLRIKLFDLFEVDTVSVNVVDKKSIYPCGFPIGMYFKTDGVMVIGTGEFKDYVGNMVSPCNNILQKGDYIVAINGEEVTSKTMLNEAINEAKGSNIVLKVRRNGDYIELTVKPQLTETGDYKIGLWVKDDAQGLGTMTYVSDNGDFGALGHGISDSALGELIEISAGTIYKTRIVTIIKGENGKPGEFIGTIDYSSKNKMGIIESNYSCGIFGKLYTNLIDEYNLSKMEVGYSYQVHKGRAYVRMYQEKSGSSEYKDYDIEITDVRAAEAKNITFEVTSSELLELTNGIVQGMSGCPIIQDGKLVGAVTHVFVDDSHDGYGIFIEKMLQNE